MMWTVAIILLATYVLGQTTAPESITIWQYGDRGALAGALSHDQDVMYPIGTSGVGDAAETTWVILEPNSSHETNSLTIVPTDHGSGYRAVGTTSGESYVVRCGFTASAQGACVGEVVVTNPTTTVRVTTTLEAGSAAPYIVRVTSPPTATEVSTVPSSSGQSPHHTGRTPLIVGCIVGIVGSLLVAIGMLIVFLRYRRNKANQGEEMREGSNETGGSALSEVRDQPGRVTPFDLSSSPGCSTWPETSRSSFTTEKGLLRMSPPPERMQGLHAIPEPRRDSDEGTDLPPSYASHYHH